MADDIAGLREFVYEYKRAGCPDGCLLHCVLTANAAEVCGITFIFSDGASPPTYR
jgi:hypothetical protein